MPRITASAVQQDMTGDYLAAGSPPPYTMRAAKRAARTAFRSSAPSSTRPWIGYARVETATSEQVVGLQITRAKAGSKRIGSVLILGTVENGR
jgi:hypothetical protein